ncbi:AraC family transcriptional regulator [Gryllotalpicola reticulitermitis]|uniref:AraC family transcriptional regulator n=1 Tax=Gryllotalpicola reticulitermitis TaxID=1184153 RepID=A0ABV8Q1F5_9MICO
MRENSQAVEQVSSLAVPRQVPANLHRALGAGELIDAHHHDRNQIVYPAHGLLAVTTSQGTWMAPPHRAVWIPAFTEHQHRAWGATDMRGVLMSARTRSLFPKPTPITVMPLLRELLLALTEPDPLSVAQRRRLEAVVLDRLVPSDDQPLHLPEARDDRLRDVLAALQADPATRASLSELGHQVGASERTLSRLFQVELGMTFPQWRTQLRIHQGLMLLAEGQSVTRAAAETGWTTTSAFIEAFAQVVGTTPGRYLADLQHR